jgi:hypothetical protein
MVCALKGSNRANVLKEEDKSGYLSWIEGEQEKPDRLRLADFLELYERIKSDRMLLYTDSKPFRPSGQQGASIKKLNSLRNQFIHFLPQGMSLLIDGLPDLIANCLDVIAFLAFESGNITWSDEQSERRTGTALQDLRSMLNSNYRSKAAPS